MADKNAILDMHKLGARVKKDLLWLLSSLAVAVAAALGTNALIKL